ncbi:hypothetical protein F4802DRAFT_456498 [Xylaria palmicola]|nr:hypothetical protein F4802DRAFT_456498 [Xylaria palmicola]
MQPKNDMFPRAETCRLHIVQEDLCRRARTDRKTWLHHGTTRIYLPIIVFIVFIVLPYHVNFGPTQRFAPIAVAVALLHVTRQLVCTHTHTHTRDTRL